MTGTRSYWRAAIPLKASWIRMAATLTGVCATSGFMLYNTARANESCEWPKCQTCPPNPKKLPTIPLSEVEKHTDHHSRIWVTYKGGVYDVTDFLECHPGGPARIEMCAGGDLKAAWEVYDLHPKRQHILGILETYRVGNLSPEDTKIVEARSALGNTYDSDPDHTYQKRTHRVASEHPWNSEPSLGVLGSNFITANEDFFIRGHNAIPAIDGDEYELTVQENQALGIRPVTLSLKDLKEKFQKHEVTCTISCAGVRQQEFLHPPGRGQKELKSEESKEPLYIAPHWEGGAIGNAKWGGVLLRDVLEYAGLDVDAITLGKRSTKDCQWVSFIGHDTDETGVNYAGVLPIEKAVGATEDTLLAFEMNGKTLPADHGFPIRVVAPGRAGCRQVKWVTGISVDAAPSNLDSGSKLDRHFCRDISFEHHIRFGESKLRLDQAPVLQTLGVQSIVCRPSNNAQISLAKGADSVEISGIAYAGGGRGISRVEVSIDGGKKFTGAEVDTPLDYSYAGRNWAWVRFHQKVPLTAEMKKKLSKGKKLELEFVSRAVDGDFNFQPESMNSTWNCMGICANHLHRVPVTVTQQRS